MLRVFVPPSLRHWEPLRPIDPARQLLAAFAYDITQALRPRLVVDLATGDGAAFFSSCESMKDHDVDGAAYAIDDWSAYTGPEAPTYEELNAHGRQFFMGLAYFVRMAPNEAGRHFASAAIDLLSIGGSRDTVPAADVAAWVERVSPGGAIIVRDTGTESGARLWERVSREHRGAAISLPGAGVVLGTEVDRQSELVRMMLQPGHHDALRAFYEHVAHHHTMRSRTNSTAFASRKKQPR